MAKRIAVFDFDGTIYKGDSFIDFAIFCRGKSRLFFSIISNILSLIKWKTDIIDNGKAKENLFGSLFRNYDYKSFLNSADKFTKIIESKLNNDTYTKLLNHLKSGDKVFIVTASPAEWILPWANKNNITMVIGTKLEINNEVLTGRFSSANCYGKEKLRRFLEQEPIRDEYELYCYGDSKGDKELMEISDYPQWIN